MPPYRRGLLGWELRHSQVQALAKIKGSVIRGLTGGVGPEVEGIAGSSAFEAVENMLLQVDGEAAAGAGRGPVQRARATLLCTVAAPGAEAKELQHG